MAAAALLVLDDGSADWASAFAAAGGRPPPPATLAIELCPAAPRRAREASFARLAAEARREAVFRADESVLSSAFAALMIRRQDGNDEEGMASIDAFREVAVRRLGLSGGAFERRLRRARVAATNAAAAAAAAGAGGLSVGGSGAGGSTGGGEMSYAQFRAALLADV